MQISSTSRIKCELENLLKKSDLRIITWHEIYSKIIGHLCREDVKTTTGPKEIMVTHVAYRRDPQDCKSFLIKSKVKEKKE